MSTLSEISKLIRELRNFLETRLTPQLMSSLQSALDSINQTLGDPNVQANIKAALAELKTLLESANSHNLVGQISDITKQAQEILKSIDPQAVKSIIETINQLLTEADKANIIQNITNALNSVSCLRDLVDIANELVLPTKVFLYGTTGAVIGIAITTAVQAYLKNKRDQKLQQSIDQLIALNSHQLYVQIHLLRNSAGNYLVNIETAKQQNPKFVLPERLQRLQDQNIRLLDALPPIDVDTLQLLTVAEQFANKMLHKIYQPALDNENINDYLDRVGSDLSVWDDLTTYLTRQAHIRLFGQLQRPDLPRDDLNYLQVKKHYIPKVIDRIMRGLVEKIKENGGEELFTGLANSFENTIDELSFCIQQIERQKKNSNFTFPDSPWSAAANKLLKYHRQAQTYIKTEWGKASWLPLQKPQLTQRISLIIQTRALAEFCYQTAPRLCFPRNVPREIINGAIDIPVGLYRLVTTNPVTTVSNLWNGIFTASGRQNFINSIYYHPTRALANTAFSYGITAGANRLAHISTTSSINHLHKNIQIRGAYSGIADKASSSMVMVRGESAALATNSLTQRQRDITKQQHAGTDRDSNDNGCLELTKASQLIIRKESFDILNLQLSSARNIDEIYRIIINWYESIYPDEKSSTSKKCSSQFFSSNSNQQAGRMSAVKINFG